MPENGFVMRFFGCVQLPVGVVGAERSIQLSYGRIATFYRCRQYIPHFSPEGKCFFDFEPKYLCRTTIDIGTEE